MGLGLELGLGLGLGFNAPLGPRRGLRRGRRPHPKAAGCGFGSPLGYDRGPETGAIHVQRERRCQIGKREGVVRERVIVGRDLLKVMGMGMGRQALFSQHKKLKRGGIPLPQLLLSLHGVHDGPKKGNHGFTVNTREVPISPPGPGLAPWSRPRCRLPFHDSAVPPSARP